MMCPSVIGFSKLYVSPPGGCIAYLLACEPFFTNCHQRDITLFHHPFDLIWALILKNVADKLNL